MRERLSQVKDKGVKWSVCVVLCVGDFKAETDVQIAKHNSNCLTFLTMTAPMPLLVPLPPRTDAWLECFYLGRGVRTTTGVFSPFAVYF